MAWQADYLTCMAWKRSVVRARLAPLHGISAAQSLAERGGGHGTLVDQRYCPGRTPVLLLQVKALRRSDSECLRISQLGFLLLVLCM